VKSKAQQQCLAACNIDRPCGAQYRVVPEPMAAQQRPLL